MQPAGEAQRTPRRSQPKQQRWCGAGLHGTGDHDKRNQPARPTRTALEWGVRRRVAMPPLTRSATISVNDAAVAGIEAWFILGAVRIGASRCWRLNFVGNRHPGRVGGVRPRLITKPVASPSPRAATRPGRG
jgi:hypothetical protein